MSIHYHIVQAIRKANEAKPTVFATDIPNLTDEELIRSMFVNFRNGNEHKRGLQLSQGGRAIMGTFFKKFEVVFPEQTTFSSRHILYLDRTCSMPWHATNLLPITITFFEADLAMRAKLVGDLDVLLTAFSG